MEQWSCSVNPEGVCARDQRDTPESGGKHKSKKHSYVYTCIFIKSQICLFPILVGVCTPYRLPPFILVSACCQFGSSLMFENSHPPSPLSVKGYGVLVQNHLYLHLYICVWVAAFERRCHASALQHSDSWRRIWHQKY